MAWCVVRDPNSGHQLLFQPANWCPIFASRTTHACDCRPNEDFGFLIVFVLTLDLVLAGLAQWVCGFVFPLPTRPKF